VLSYGAWRHAQTLSLPMWRKLLLIFANCRDTNPQCSATVVSLGFANMNKSRALSKEHAQRIYALGEGSVVFGLLLLSKQLAEGRARLAAASHETPSTPSGMKPPYQKPPAKARRKAPGRKPGHEGYRRARPEPIDRRKEHRAPCCPERGEPLTQCEQTRTRYTEDIPGSPAGGH
jgi:hypothetical protein